MTGLCIDKISQHWKSWCLAHPRFPKSPLAICDTPPHTHTHTHTIYHISAWLFELWYVIASVKPRIDRFKGFVANDGGLGLNAFLPKIDWKIFLLLSFWHTHWQIGLITPVYIIRYNRFMPIFIAIDGQLVSWCFEPSQPQRITSGRNTNFTLSPNNSSHKSSYHKSCFFVFF